MSSIVRTAWLVVGWLALCIVGLSCSTDRPLFYSRTNIAEYYGRCPECNRWVKGYFCITEYGEAQGSKSGSSQDYRGRCKHCGASVVADYEYRPYKKDDLRIVKWRLQ